MTKAAEKAATAIIRDFGELEHLQISSKGPRNFATSADQKAEDRIMYILSKAYPEISFICEEKGVEFRDNEDVAWIIDPIDGTSNFMRGIPYFAISIALSENLKITTGLTLDPLRNECFKTELGGGAFINDRNRMRVSGRKNIFEAVIATHTTLSDEEILVKNGGMIRKMGAVSLDMAYVAAGKYDACVFRDVMLWDIATGVLLIKESGGFVKYRKHDSGKFDVIAASSGELFKTIIKFFNF
jgi:myo-inositol-1(or 4)-monophosphatase